MSIPVPSPAVTNKDVLYPTMAPGIAKVMSKPKHLKHTLMLLVPSPIATILGSLYRTMAAGFAKVMPRLKHLKHMLNIVLQQTVDKVDQFKRYLALFFSEPGNDWMNWDNQGRREGVRCWEIDHIYPLSKLDLTDPELLRRANHWSNFTIECSRQQWQVLIFLSDFLTSKYCLSV